MFIPEEIDYDRLHSVIECINTGKPTPRQAGRTFAFMHLMVGEMELGDFNNVYLYVAPSHDLALHTMREFAEYAKRLYDPYVFDSINQSSLTLVTTHRQRYIFMGHQDPLRLMHTLHGVKIARAFIDTTPRDQLWLSEICARVKPTGGDVLF